MHAVSNLDTQAQLQLTAEQQGPLTHLHAVNKVFNTVRQDDARHISICDATAQHILSWYKICLNASVPDVSCSAAAKDGLAPTLDPTPVRTLQVLQSCPTRPLN